MHILKNNHKWVSIQNGKDLNVSYIVEQIQTICNVLLIFPNIKTNESMQWRLIAKLSHSAFALTSYSKFSYRGTQHVVFLFIIKIR